MGISKKKILPILIFILSGVFNIVKADNLYLSPLTLNAGGESEIVFNLNNTTPFYGFQLDLVLPTGVTTVDSNGSPTVNLGSRFNASYIVQSNVMSDGSVRILSYSIRHEAISGNSGRLFSVPVNVASNFNGGSIEVKGIKFTNASNNDVNLPSVSQSPVVSVPTSQDNFYIENFEIHAGETKEVTIMLKNQTEFTAFQTDLLLSSNLSIVSGSLQLTERTSDHSLSIASSGQTTKIAVLSSNNETFSGNDGGVIKFSVTASDNEGSGIISLSNNIFTATNLQEFILKDSQYNVTILTPTVLSVSLNKNELTMKVGETETLTATTYPDNAPDKSLNWTSTEPGVATVGNNGEITAQNIGKTVIRATSTANPDAFAECVVNVEPVPATSVSLSLQNLNIMVGSAKVLTAKVSPHNATDKNITWSSESPEVATVTPEGLVTALTRGIATIKATCGDVSANCEVNVYDSSQVTVLPGNNASNGNDDNSPAENTTDGGSLQGNNLTLRVNQTASIQLQLPNLTEEPALEWSLADDGNSIVALTKTSNTIGTFQGLRMGNTIYTVKISDTSNVVAQGTITVIGEYPMTSLSLNPVELSVAKNADPFFIKAQFSPDNANPALLSWTSSDPTVASVDNGTVTILNEGKTTITATANDGSNLSATSKITVTAPIDRDFKFDFSNDDSLMSDEEGITLYLGDKYQFKPKAQDGYALPENLIWSSDPNTIVSVTSTGEITALKIGEATVTASAIFNNETISSSCKVKVIPVPASSVTLNSNNLHLFIGQQATLEATVMPVNTTDKTVSWKSDQESIVSVTRDGKITALTTGSTNITAICGSVSAVCQVTVSGQDNVKVVPGNGTTEGDEGESPAGNTSKGGSMIGNDLTLRVGQTAGIKIELPENLSSNPNLSWSLNDDGSRIVEMTVNGNTLEAWFKGLQMGKTSYTVSFENKEITGGNITVIAETPMASLTVDPAIISVAKNINPFLVQAQFTPQNATATNLTWSSSQPNVAKVDNGTVTVLTEGETIITATANDGSNLSAECYVTVTAPVDQNFKFDFSDASMSGIDGLSIYLGDTYTLKPKAQTGYDLPENISWTSSHNDVVSVNDKGEIKGLAIGEATITASALFNGQTVKATCKVNVIAIPASEIQLNTSNATMLIGETLQIQATVKPDNTTYPTISWTSSDDKVAIVSATGVVTGVAEGSVTITATCGDVSASCEVKVNPVPASSIEMTLQDITLLVGATSKLSAKVLPDNTTYPTIIWSSSDTGVATVKEDGTVTAVAVGTTDIIATCGSATATCKVTVNPVPAESIEMETQNVTLLLGYSTKLSAKVLPDNTTYPTITWSSSDTGVATVKEDGTVTAVAVGTADIIATCGSATATCKVTVNPVPAESIELELKDVSMFVGYTTKLSAKVLPDNTTYPTITWSSSNIKIANVSEDGTVTALSPGTVTITATCGSAMATCKVIVNPVTSQGLTISPSSVSLVIGTKVTLTATITPENTTDKTVTWTSSNHSVATVSQSGVVSAVSVGSVVITANNGDRTATCEVTVTPVLSSSVTLNVQNLNLLVGASSTLIATLTPANTTDKTLTWTSSNPAVATVTANGVVTGIKPGNATITVKNGNNTATCRVTVDPITASSVTLNVREASLKVGSNTTLVATVSPANTTDKTLTWKSDNTSVATVSSSGLVTAITPGVANITVTCGKASATCKVTVLPITATSISLNVEDQTIFVSATTQLKATVSPDNTTDKTVTWSSDNTKVATVDANGLVTAIAVGTAKITATSGSVSASCVIKVEPRPTPPITVNTSETNVSTMDGKQVMMWVSTEGGNPDGWTFAWTSKGESISSEKNLEITAHNNNALSVTETYAVAVTNVNDGVTIYSETFTFNIEIWPAVSRPFGDGADDPDLVGNNTDTSQDEEGWWQRNGIHIETLRAWEGKEVGMWAEQPSGGYIDGWKYSWDINGDLIGTSQQITYKAAMTAGEGMEIASQTPLVTYKNYGPSGELWTQFAAYGPTLDVYRRPQTPLMMLRDPDGTTNTFSAVMTLSDSQLSQYEYQFVFGYKDSEGSNITLGTSNDRHYTTTEDIYNDSSYEFWVYTIWRYPDGSVISSALRYLNGSVDEDFNGSSFSGVSNVVYDGDLSESIYSLSGIYMGKDASGLAPGVYVKVTTGNGKKTSQKFIVR